VVATSDLEREEDLELIAGVKGTAPAAAAHREIVRLRREYEANLGQALMQALAGKPFPQSELDFKRGFYHGLLWGWTTFLENAAPKLARLEEALAAEKE
jgi:hypothetical protein